MDKRIRSRLAADETGMTIIELVVAATVTLLAMGLIGGTLIAAQQVVAQQTQRSILNDQARLAAQQLDREVRSSSLLYAPQSDTMRVYQRSSTERRCIQWKIEDRQLLRRHWAASFGDPVDASSVTGWRVVAEHIVNQVLVDTNGVPSPVSAFTLTDPQTPTDVGRTVQVVILLSHRSSPTMDDTVVVQQSLFGRNTTRGSAQDIQACEVVPS